LIHLSVRLAWHDTGWNGCICREPRLNSSCIVQEQIRDGRDDELERQHAGVHLADISDWLPPCCRDIAAYADRGFTFIPFPEALIHRTRRGVLVRSKSEVIVANVLDNLVDDPGEIDWKYEEPLFHPDAPRDYRLPDFTIGFAGDIYYWEHLGMLSVPAYREGWERKRRWYEEVMGILVIGPGAAPGREVEPGVSPLVITSRDGDDGSIDQQRIEALARRYILLEG